MGARPDIVQLWGNAAASGALVQPPTGVAAAGFATADQPPAQWFNWNFANYAAWIDYLRGANPEHWTRTAWGTSPATFDSGTALFLAVDTETQDATGAAFRYLIAGQETDTPNTAALRTSKRGNEWVRRTNVTATATAVPSALAYADNPASSGRWLLGCNDASINYCTVDAGGGTGPVGSGSGSWSVATTPGGMTSVVAFAVKETTKIFAVTNDGGVQSTDHGVTWTNYAGTSGTARSGNGSDACYTGNAFLFVTTDGQIYKSSTVGGVFAYVTDLGASATWRLAADGEGGVLAYRANNGSTLDLFWSDDDGDTWETITPTTGFQRIQRIRHHEGTWLACSTVAPFLWSSNDHETWRKLRMPVGSDAALYDLAWDGGAWVAAGNGFVLQCPRGHDPGDADGVWTPGSTATRLVDAAYIRGVEVDSTAPTNGQVLAYDSTAGRWEPTALTGSSPTTTPGDLIVRGASADERLAIGTVGKYLRSDGSAPGWQGIAVADVTAERTAVADTGWTDAVTGTATAAHSSGVHTLGTDNGGSVLSHRAAPSTPEYPAIEIIGRFDVTTGAPGTGWWSGFGLRNAANTYGYLVQVAESGAVALWHAHGTGYSLVGSAGSVSLTSGDVWLRLVVMPSYAAAYYGTGSGSTPPTSWTLVASTTTVVATLAAGHLSRVGLHAGRAASGSGTYTVEWRDVQTRLLGLSL